MSRKFKIRSLNNWSIVATVVLAILCIVIFALGFKKYAVLRSAVQDYIDCEASARKLQEGSDTLTKQVRLAAATGEQKYISAYFQEAKVTKSRENALEDLSDLHGDPDAISPLREALSASMKLMQTEYYSMRLVEEAMHIDSSQWPADVKAVELTAEDVALSDQEKLHRAQVMLIGTEYEEAKDEIREDINAALSVLTDEILERQYQAADVFEGIFRSIIACVIIFAVMMLLVCLIIRRGIMQPLLEYNESIREGAISPIRGVQELQKLAETYNNIYAENEERAMLMKHQAEHDSLTELLNRRSFEQILRLANKDQGNFALILADVDDFKRVNDTYGHAVGDSVLKNVARLLRTVFRSIDHVCRIGGDEFAIIMVNMTRDMCHIITDKIAEINQQLADPNEGLPVASLSVGIAFSNPGESVGELFKNADSALYCTKKSGGRGCSLYPLPKS